MSSERIYPVGIQDFEKLRNKGAIYVDKTDLIYSLVTVGNLALCSKKNSVNRKHWLVCKLLIIQTVYDIIEQN